MNKDTMKALDAVSEREAFEAWIAKECGDLSTFGSGANLHYRNSAVNNAWTGWDARSRRFTSTQQAAKSAAASDLTEEVARLRMLAATCYAGLGAEHDLPEKWLDVLNAAANGDPFNVDHLLPYTAAVKSGAPSGDSLWKLLEAVTEELNRIAAPGTYLTQAWQVGSKFINNLAAAKSAAPAAVGLTLKDESAYMVTRPVDVGVGMDSETVLSWEPGEEDEESEPLYTRAAVLASLSAPMPATQAPAAVGLIYQLRAPLGPDWQDTPKPPHMTDDGYGAWYEVPEATYRRLLQAGTHKHRVLCEALSAPMPAGAAVGEWQPIETAPQGVKGVAWMMLAWGREGDQSVGTGMRIGERFFAAGTFYRLGREKAFEFCEVEVKPTHWQALPVPPTTGGEQ